MEESISATHEIKHRPVICILGSTSVGKSQLALDICASSDPLDSYEVINADAMQVFHGLDIATNKPTSQELKQVRHHMFSIVDPFPKQQEQPLQASMLYTVNDYVKRVDELIRDVHSRNKIPIVVGGTNYYIKALFYECMKLESGDGQSHQQQEQQERVDNEEKEQQNAIVDCCYTFERLKQILPDVAQKLHPNDHRKIRNAIMRFERQQEEEKNGHQTTSETLRYPNSLFIYLSYEARVELDQRINQRVLDMIHRGLLDELKQFYVQYRNQIEALDADRRYEYGILQCIGYKEFEPLVTYWYEHTYLKGEAQEEQSTTEEEKRLLEQCTSGLQAATRRYARKQESWYRNTWASPQSPLIQQGILFRFDMSDASTRQDKVRDAILTSKQFSKGEPIMTRALYQVTTTVTPDNQKNEWRKYVCEDCKRECNGDLEYQQHLKSRAHRNVRTRLKRKRSNEQQTPQ